MKLIFDYDEEQVTGHVKQPRVEAKENENDNYFTKIYDYNKNYSNNHENKEVDDFFKELPDDLIRGKNEELPIPNISELSVIRHYTNLSRLNYGIDVGIYPLGSCTMKYNPRVNEDIANLEGFRSIHPLSGEDFIQGCLELMWELEQDLKKITGMDAFSLQPVAGAQGELLGLMIAKRYQKQRGEKRSKVIIPDSAHGTNPATAAMCKCDTVTIPTDERGNMDLSKFKQALDDQVLVVMLTNPNTLGLFEENIMEICDLAHRSGTLMYCDGANMNALLGITKPSDQGFDIIHLNLHKTFSTPHGGGGPGAGVVGVKSFLADFLPIPRVIKKDYNPSKEKRLRTAFSSYSSACSSSTSSSSSSIAFAATSFPLPSQPSVRYGLDYSRRKSVGKVRCFYGNFGMLVRAYSYIKSWGNDIRKVSEYAILNANYLLSQLKDIYELPYERTCAHEFVLSSKKFGEKSALHIAKRLLDYKIHPPTIYFPLIVKEALMIEPTETESKTTLDQFVLALKSIAIELKENPEIVISAPHTKSVARLDEVKAARSPNLRWSKNTDTDRS